MSLMILPLLAVSCEKEGGGSGGGEFTIDNTLYGYGPYYAIGYSFGQGSKISTMESPGPDITVHARTDAEGNVSGAYIDTPQLTESFALAGEFDTEEEAKNFFDRLTGPVSYTWSSYAGDVKKNQVWLFKTSGEDYVRIRIISMLLSDTAEGPYVEMTAEWSMLPAGTKSSAVDG